MTSEHTCPQCKRVAFVDLDGKHRCAEGHPLVTWWAYRPKYKRPTLDAQILCFLALWLAIVALWILFFFV